MHIWRITGGYSCGAMLTQKGRLPGPTRADYCHGFSRNVWKPNVPAGEVTDRNRQALGKLRLKNGTGYCPWHKDKF
jgi:hypothetical protein